MRSIAGRLSLRQPQTESLDILHNALDEDVVAQDLGDGIAGAFRGEAFVGPEAEGVEVVDAQPVAQQDEEQEDDERGGFGNRVSSEKPGFCTY